LRLKELRQLYVRHAAQDDERRSPDLPRLHLYLEQDDNVRRFINSFAITQAKPQKAQKNKTP